MLNNPKVRNAVRGMLDPPAKFLLRLHISPDAVTVVGTLGAVVCAVLFIAQGSFLFGVTGVVVFAAADLLDGAMARMNGSSGPWGNFLDSSLDRVADGAIFGSVAFWAAASGEMWLAAGTLIALVAGQVTSYAKARAESVGAQANVGLVERAERLIAILAALFLSGVGVPWVLDIVIWALAVLGVVTVIQRFIHVRKQLKPRAETP